MIDLASLAADRQRKLAAIEQHCLRERDDALRLYGSYLREGDEFNAKYWKGRADALRALLKEVQ